MTPEPARVDSGELFRVQRTRLWGLAYRLTGSAEDADDVVQETFVRWMERSPGHAAAPGPWLVRVATNLGIDALRARRRRAYPGPWLPAPTERSDEDWLAAFPSGEPDPEARYGLLESATLAFLAALEALAPRPRAVLVLRDVFGYSAAETAATLGTTEGNVRVVHLRARRTMERYDRERCVPTPELRARHHAALDRLLRCLVAQDVAMLESLLAESVRTVTDAGGEYTALRTPVAGRTRVARFYARAAANRVAGGPSFHIGLVNALPAAVITLAHPVRKQAPLSVLSLRLADDGTIREIHTVLESRKLVALAGR
jgi:RNA polymerase sigma-70 factor (ECF subfamily)